MPQKRKNKDKRESFRRYKEIRLSLLLLDLKDDLSINGVPFNFFTLTTRENYL